MRIQNLFHTLGRNLRFWYYTKTSVFRSYTKKIRDLEDHAKRLREEAKSLDMKAAAIPEMETANDESLSIQQFEPKETIRIPKTLVTVKREYQGGAESGRYELGYRFDALCNRLEGQLMNGEREGAQATVKALEEIDSRLHHNDKSSVLFKIKKTLIKK